MTHRILRRAPVIAGIAAAVTHIGALRNGFALDDATIAAHPLIQHPSTLPAALASPWWYESGRLYRPLALLSLGLDRLVGGVAFSHAVNVALHAVIAGLVTTLARRWLAPPASLVAGLLVALLPVHAEAVSTIVGRAELLSALGMVGVMLLVTRADPPTARARFAAALLAIVALGAKESGAAAPVLAFAAAFAIPAQREHARRWATSALLGTLLLIGARALVLGTVAGDVPHPYFRGMSAMTRIQVALALLPRSATMLTLPVAPAMEEVPPQSSATDPSMLPVLAGAVLLVAVLALVVRHARRPTALTLGAWVLAATIAPTSNLLFAEGALTARTLYAPSIGAALMLAALAQRLRATRGHALVGTALAASCMAGAVMSWRETSVWRDTPTVAATMVERRPDNYRGHEFLAYAARDAGRLDQSMSHFGQAIALFPRDAEMMTDAATVALRLRDTVTATNWLETAVQVSPRSARARTRLFALARARGDTAHAYALLRDGLRREPTQRTWAALLASRSSPANERSVALSDTSRPAGPDDVKESRSERLAAGSR
jgi:tetratricopeptide (TPR) repeat protein